MSSQSVGIRPLKQRLLALATVAAMLFLLLDVLAPAAKAATFTLDIPLVVAHGAPGSELVIYEGPLPVSGGECLIIVSKASNNNSVHPGNDLRLETNGQVVNFYDVERAPDAETEGDATVVPGDTARIVVIFGPDHTFSAGVQLIFECVPSSTTTTSQATTSSSGGGSTTTTMGETTTVPNGPTTTPPPNTTTTIAEGSTTTVPEAPTTTAAEDTTTTIASVSTSTGDTTTTIAAVSTTPPDEVLDTEVLPFTGLETGRIGFVALTLLGIGVLLGIAARERRE
jgi:hypothetical protein